MSLVMVVGAQPGSIGDAVAEQCRALGYATCTAGLGGEEVHVDLVRDNMPSLISMLATVNPDHIVCTVGMNMAEPEDLLDPTDWYDWHFQVNVTAPMRLLHAWTRMLSNGHGLNHYVAISSNSSRVPRSRSAAYCASKAALSQALRVKAREGAVRVGSPIIYGYEPGLVAGTPMTEAAARQWPGVPLTRMRDQRLSTGIPVGSLAWWVCQNLTLGPELNGMLIPLDADEA
jgi:NAD(P)-dependent dehydrogenase (short-subunit alcohol dehydrogenase family)